MGIVILRSMKFTPIGEIDLTYIAIDFVEYGIGGQYYGEMEGQLRTERVSGRLKLTNVAQKRSDNVNTPTLRGVLETDEGARVFLEMNGLSQIEEGGRVFIASLTFRTADPRYEGLNTLFAVVEGELHGPPRPNEMHARCRVYVCEATIKPSTAGGSALPVVIGYAVTAADPDVELRAPATDTERRGIARATAFRQSSSNGEMVLIYRETDGATAAEPPVPAEMLIRQRPSRRGSLYLLALPVLAGKAARLHEFSTELNGIHFTEFQESLRRLGVGITVFLQHNAQDDLLLFAVEGESPTTWPQRLGTSTDPFDRWFAQELSEQSGVVMSALPSVVNEELWSWDMAAVRSGES
jgi:hypothetical protein